MIDAPRPPSDPPSPSSEPDALDPLEARAGQALRSAGAAGLAEILAALPPSPPAAPPSAAPDAGRSSSAELRALLQAGTGAPCGPLEGARGGYIVAGSQDEGSAFVRPAFAEALAASLPAAELRRSFADLWAIDLEVWEALDRDPREVARLWLESPGRRLLQDLRALRALPATDPRRATDLRLERIHRAAGVADAPLPSDATAFDPWARARLPAWRALHLSAPGHPMLLWSPAAADVTDAFQALDLADEGSPASLRGAALAWLLTRARDTPHYEVGGIARDLRDDLPARLAEAFDSEARTAARAPAALEEVALAHAARIHESDHAPGRVLRTWAVARWLAACVWRSPFFGGDEPTLVARLRALLPHALPGARDALDPAWFRADGLDVAEVALVGGALAHPTRVGGVAAVPPAPLIRKLRDIAARPSLRPAEIAAEDLLARGANELAWSAPHVAPPLAARFWLTERQIAWLASAPAAAQAQTIDLLARHPERFGWTCFAMMEEGAALAPDAKESALTLWKTMRSASVPKTHERCAFGIGLLGALDSTGAEGLIDLAATAEGTWPPFLLDAIAKTADKTELPGVWQRSLERLLDLAERTEPSDTIRLNAALFVAWRTSGRKTTPPGISERLATLAAQPPFVRHAGLQRELRRRGVAIKSASGGGR